MGKSAEERLASLEELVTTQNSKLQKSLKITIVVYLILIVVVFGYTTHVAKMIKTYTSKEEVAAMVGAELSHQIPLKRKEMIDQLNANTQKYAVQAVSNLKENGVKHLENEIHTLMNDYTDKMISDVKEQIVPSFSEYIKEDAQDINDKFNELTDEEVVTGVVGLMMEVIEKEMDNHINEAFVDSLNELQVKIDRLGMPNAKLTKKEDATRRVIMYWTFLSEVTETGESPFKQIFEELNDKYRFFSGEDLEQINVPLVEDE